MPRLSHAILYDADDKGRETLAYGFEVDGLKVTATGDADEFERALTASPAPDAAIVVLREEDDRAIPLLRALAERTPPPLPRLVLADADVLPEAVTQMNLPGAAGFLPLPAFVRDVVTAAKLLAGGAARGEESALEGALSDFGIFFILRTMVALGLSGIVEVNRSNRKGELRFADGDVVSAQVGSLEGLPALHQLLLWEEAALVIRFRATARRSQEFLKGEELLDDCARFLRDFEHATRTIGHAQSLFVQDAEKTAELGDAVTAELTPVLRLFDGHRNLGDVLEDSPYRVFDTLRTAARLIELKTIRRKAIEKPTTGLPPGRRPRPAQEDWLGRGVELAQAAGASPGTNRAPLTASADGAPAPARIERAAGASMSETAARGRRSFRRKTGEHAIAPAPAPGSETAANRPAPTPTITVTSETPAVAPPPVEAAALPATVPLPVPVDRPPAAATQTSANSTVATAAPAQYTRRATGGIAQAQGELRSSASDQMRQVVTDVPTMLIDLGPDVIDADTGADGAATPPPVEIAKTTAKLPTAVAAAAPITPAPVTPRPMPATSITPAQTAPVAAPAAATPPTSSFVQQPAPFAETLAPAVQTAPTQAAPTIESSMETETESPTASPAIEPASVRRADVHAAEIDTGMRPQPAAALLEAPATGPSIMIDPRLVEEMDAFELENSSPTPPPVLTGTPPPAARATASGTLTAAPPGGVVSFVRGAAVRNTGAARDFNNAPTVQVSPSIGEAASPASASAPAGPAPTALAVEAMAVPTVPDALESAAAAPATPTATTTPTTAATPATVTATAAATPAPAAEASPARHHTPGAPRSDRRGSGEFDALESEFFARESDLYAKEPVENFDDLDAGKGKPPPR